MDKREINEDFKMTFSSPHGQRVLDWLKRSNFIDTSLVPLSESIDRDRVMMNEGRRQVILGIMRKIEKGKTNE